MPQPTNPDSNSTPPLRPDGRNGDRLRWGLTGLAAVFLIVMAAAGLRPASPPNKPGAGEPLAVLGVAPGSATRPAEDQ